MVNGQAFAGTAFELDGTDNQDPILGIIVINPDDGRGNGNQDHDAELRCRVGQGRFCGRYCSDQIGHQQFSRERIRLPHRATRTSHAIRSARRPKSSRDAHKLSPSVPGRLEEPLWRFYRRTDHQATGCSSLGTMKGSGRRLGQSATDTLPTSLLTETALGNTLARAAFPAPTSANTRHNLARPESSMTLAAGNGTAYPAGNVIPTAQLCTCRHSPLPCSNFLSRSPRASDWARQET